MAFESVQENSRTWFCHLEVTTFAGRKIQKIEQVTDPSRHYAEFRKRFFPTAKTVEWYPVDGLNLEGKAKQIGPKRGVEFDLEGLHVARWPDDDAAHAGGVQYDEGPMLGKDLAWWKKRGESRKGVDPRQLRHVGVAPTYGDFNDDEGEVTQEELKQMHKQVQEKLAKAPRVKDPWEEDEHETPVGRQPDGKVVNVSEQENGGSSDGTTPQGVGSGNEVDSGGHSQRSETNRVEALPAGVETESTPGEQNG